VPSTSTIENPAGAASATDAHRGAVEEQANGAGIVLMTPHRQVPGVL
jgi:hypothetical protein